MKLDEADLEKSYFEPVGKGVDKSIGYFLVGLVVILCFSFFVFGMNRIQTASDQAVGEGPRSVDASAPEIGEVIDPTKN